MLARRDLDARRFSSAQRDALFDAVLVDDEVDAKTFLPHRIMLDHDQSVFVDCFCICRQLWLEGVDHRELLTLLDNLEQNRDLDVDERQLFKYARAKLKHLRFACALYSDSHRYPPVMDWMTTAFGHLQDAFKTGQQGRVLRRVWLCRMLLSNGPQALMRREHDRLTPTSGAGFRTYLGREISDLEQILISPEITGSQFHSARKIASRQVSFYSTLGTISPSDERHLMSRSLAAINGLMGSLHDQLIERRFAGLQDYHRDAFVLPDEIRGRIADLIKCFRISGL